MIYALIGAISLSINPKGVSNSHKIFWINVNNCAAYTCTVHRNLQETAPYSILFSSLIPPIFLQQNGAWIRRDLRDTLPYIIYVFLQALYSVNNSDSKYLNNEHIMHASQLPECEDPYIFAL